MSLICCLREVSFVYVQVEKPGCIGGTGEGGSMDACGAGGEHGCIGGSGEGGGGQHGCVWRRGEEGLAWMDWRGAGGKACVRVWGGFHSIAVSPT
eukprot:364871-Chlamydomonas_euryale.AAC.2